MARTEIGTSGPGRRTMASALVLAIVVIAGACSSSDSGSPTDVSTSTTASTVPGPPLVASFDIDIKHDTTRPTSCPVVSVTLTDTSEGEPTSWLWDLPDGSTSTEQSPVLTGDDVIGAGEVTLTVSRGDLSDTATDTIDPVVC